MRGVCDPVDGMCTCPPGWTGPLCDQRACSRYDIYSSPNYDIIFVPTQGDKGPESVQSKVSRGVFGPLAGVEPSGKKKCQLPWTNASRVCWHFTSLVELLVSL